jgi:serine/threonine protein kinase
MRELLGSQQPLPFAVEQRLGMGGQASVWQVLLLQDAARTVGEAGAAGSAQSAGGGSSSFVCPENRYAVKLPFCPDQLLASFGRELLLQQPNREETLALEKGLSKHLADALASFKQEMALAQRASGDGQCLYVAQVLKLGMIQFPRISANYAVPAMLLEYAAGGSLTRAVAAYDSTAEDGLSYSNSMQGGTGTDEGGEPSTSQAQRKRGLPPAAVQHVASHIMLALESAHKNGIIHRDVKVGEQCKAASCVLLLLILADAQPAKLVSGTVFHFWDSQT